MAYSLPVNRGPHKFTENGCFLNPFQHHGVIFYLYLNYHPLGVFLDLKHSIILLILAYEDNSSNRPYLTIKL